MDLTIGDEYQVFRGEVRAFIDVNLTDEMRDGGRLATSVFAEPSRAMAWQKTLHQQGWAAPNWPKQFGGTGWDVLQRQIFAEECLKASAPPLVPMSLLMCGPCIIGYGTDEQKAEYLPKILSGEDFWCQGYSEPGAGSDLASLQTFAESDGDDYVINGTKIWTTYAQYANKMFCLVRTSREGKPQQGITFLLLDMNTPGITAEPIIGLDQVHEQNTVFFDDVRVPKANRIGKENDGWTVAKYLLMFERGGSEYSPSLHRQLQGVRTMAEQVVIGNDCLWKDPFFKRKYCELEIDILALEFTENRIKSALTSGQNPGPEASMTKILATELSQKVTELSIEAAGETCLPLQSEAIEPGATIPLIGPEYAQVVMPKYLNARASSIYGGSNEVQRGIIAKFVLGL